MLLITLTWWFGVWSWLSCFVSRGLEFWSSRFGGNMRKSSTEVQAHCEQNLMASYHWQLPGFAHFVALACVGCILPFWSFLADWFQHVSTCFNCFLKRFLHQCLFGFVWDDDNDILWQSISIHQRQSTNISSWKHVEAKLELLMDLAPDGSARFDAYLSCADIDRRAAKLPEPAWLAYSMVPGPRSAAFWP